MTVLFAPEPLGLGTPYVESFYSLMHRTASVYQVRIGALVRLLFALDKTPQSPRCGYKLGRFTGASRSTEHLVKQFHKLSGIDATHHTFLKLRSILPRTENGLLYRRHRWCPSCLDPSSGIEYGMLAHQMNRLSICPLHLCYLQDACAQCRHQPTIRWGSPTDRSCQRCRTPLWSAIKRRHRTTLTEEDEQLLSVVNYVSDPESPEPTSRWVDELREGLSFLLTANAGSYAMPELKVMAWRMRKREVALSFESMMKLASIQMISPPDLFCRPKEALASRLPHMLAARQRYAVRRSVPVDLWFDMRRAAIALIEHPFKTWEVVPSKTGLCEIVNVASSGFWQHFPDISRAYDLKRQEVMRGRNSRMFAWIAHKRYKPDAKPLKGASYGKVDERSMDSAFAIIDKHLARWIERNWRDLPLDESTR